MALPDAPGNALLQQLAGEELARLSPHFEELPVLFKQSLFEQNGPIDYLYFPESGVMSLVTDLDDGDSIETGIVGREGVAGLPALLGADRASGRAFCQVPGRAFRLPNAVMAAERERSSAWFRVLLRYVNFVSAMAAQAAACNRMHNVDARLCRWLLMMRDRVDEDEFPLTQEFLSRMLGVARPTVNIAGATLQRAGFIKYARGRLTILDRAGLESATCECYERIKQELQDSRPPAPDR